MTCEDVGSLIEPLAAGDLAVDAAAAAHLASCAGCSAALAGAREIELLLRNRPAPRAPADFVGRALARIRRDRWQREQFFDAGFNVLVALAGVAITSGAVALVYTTGLAAVGNDMVDLFVSAGVASVRGLAPSLPLYFGAAGLIAAALGVWWWAERDS